MSESMRGEDNGMRRRLGEKRMKTRQKKAEKKDGDGETLRGCSCNAMRLGL